MLLLLFPLAQLLFPTDFGHIVLLPLHNIFHVAIEIFHNVLLSVINICTELNNIATVSKVLLIFYLHMLPGQSIPYCSEVWFYTIEHFLG